MPSNRVHECRMKMNLILKLHLTTIPLLNYLPYHHTLFPKIYSEYKFVPQFNLPPDCRIITEQLP